MKINILGYTLSVQKRELTPLEDERRRMVMDEREALINILAQENQIIFLENVLEEYKERGMEDKVKQSEQSLEAAKNTLIQWEVKSDTVSDWFDAH